MEGEGEGEGEGGGEAVGVRGRVARARAKGWPALTPNAHRVGQVDGDEELLCVLVDHSHTLVARCR